MAMTPGQFKAWRKGLGLKQKEVADLLGLKKRVIQYYEKGKRDGKPVDIPRTVELACYALLVGVGGFDGTVTQSADFADPGSDESGSKRAGEKAAAAE